MNVAGIKSVKFRTRIGNRYIIMCRPLTGEFVPYGRGNNGMAYKVIVSYEDLGIDRKGLKKLLIRPNAYGISAANGVYDKDVLEIYDKNNKYDIGVVKQNEEGKWIIKAMKGDIPLTSIRYFNYISTELTGKKANAIIVDFISNNTYKMKRITV